MPNTLKPYNTYAPVAYDYIKQLPAGWKLLPNIAIFQERIEKNGIDEDVLSVSAIKGIVKSADYEDRKDRTSDDKSDYLIVHQGDIPYNTMLMWAGAVGRSEYRGIVSPAYTVLKTKKGSEINTKYYHYMFRSQFYCDYSKRFSYGIVDSRLRLYYTYFKRMYSIVPPLETQNKIVAYLDRKTAQIQEVIQKKERIIELLEEERKSGVTNKLILCNGTQNELVTTDIPYLPLVNNKANIKRLKHIASLKGRIGFKGLKASDFIDEGPYLITGTDFFDGIINWETCVHISQERYDEDPYIQVRNGDFLITKDGTIGKTAIVSDLPNQASLNSGVMLIRCLKSDFINEYLFWIVRSRIFDEFVELTKTGSTVMHLYQNSFGNFKIPIPDLETQKLIVKDIENFTHKVDNTISHIKSEISKLQEYQDSLITQVVTGQVNVE